MIDSQRGAWRWLVGCNNLRSNKRNNCFNNFLIITYKCANNLCGGYAVKFSSSAYSYMKFHAVKLSVKFYWIVRTLFHSSLHLLNLTPALDLTFEKSPWPTADQKKKRGLRRQKTSSRKRSFPTLHWLTADPNWIWLVDKSARISSRLLCHNAKNFTRKEYCTSSSRVFWSSRLIELRNQLNS